MVLFQIDRAYLFLSTKIKSNSRQNLKFDNNQIDSRETFDGNNIQSIEFA